tara:strand:- start:59 stop:658 length:600 start_codon:yes stop_codon:yes gene_type:complete
MTTKTKKEKLTDSLKKMSKKTKPKTDKNALKSLLLNDMKGKKEEERLERVKENKNLREVTIYTKFSCPHCKSMLELLDSEGIKYIEKPQLDFEEEWNYVISLTGTPVFPTLMVNGEYLCPRRDFNQPQQAINTIKIIGKKSFEFPSDELRLRENLKTISSIIQQTNQSFAQQIQSIQQKLDPIVLFINKLKEEIESEDA